MKTGEMSERHGMTRSLGSNSTDLGALRAEVFERFRVLVVAGVTVGVLVVGPQSG